MRHSLSIRILIIAIKKIWKLIKIRIRHPRKNSAHNSKKISKSKNTEDMVRKVTGKIGTVSTVRDMIRKGRGDYDTKWYHGCGSALI
jgi:hypothetical protein